MKSVGVVPPVGTWIEIKQDVSILWYGPVVPPVGTWIEIYFLLIGLFISCRAPRGHVD